MYRICAFVNIAELEYGRSRGPKYASVSSKPVLSALDKMGNVDYTLMYAEVYALDHRVTR